MHDGNREGLSALKKGCIVLAISTFDLAKKTLLALINVYAEDINLDWGRTLGGSVK